MEVNAVEYTPRTTDELSDLIGQACAESAKIEVRGNGSKRRIGAPRPNAWRVHMSAFSGISDYASSELVITAAAATPLTEIEAALKIENQMLAFEPLNYGPWLDCKTDATIGGIIASAAAGSARLARGGVRDHFLGFKAVSGRGELFVAGGRVVKNVTGYDLPKLMAGSWGRLAALTEVTLRTLPCPPYCRTFCLRGLEPRAAQQAMARAVGTPANVVGAAFVPGRPNAGESITALRLDGFLPAIDTGAAALREQLKAFGELDTLSDAEGEEFWAKIKTLELLPSEQLLWKINTTPSAAPAFIESLPEAKSWFWDWAGGLTWLASEAGVIEIRTAAERAGGHATLLRAPNGVAWPGPVFHPKPPALRTLEERVRRAFDPMAVFETGRFGDEYAD